MVVSVGGVPAGAEPGATRQDRAGSTPATRRDALRTLLASGVTVALAPVVAASGPPGPPTGTAFDEVYRGRRIRGSGTATGRALGDGRVRVTIDGRPLHLMRRADGTWLSMVDHYRSYPTPLEAARAAVDELGPGQRLRDPGDAGPAGGGHERTAPDTHPGGHHGVHA